MRKLSGWSGRGNTVLLSLFLTFPFLHGCGTLATKMDSGGGLAQASSDGGLFGGLRSGGENRPGIEGGNEIVGVRLENTDFDIPVVLNKEVEAWVKHFTGPARRHFEIYLKRMERLMPVIQPRLRAAGLPEDLIYLSMIESGFSPHAVSWAGAAGPWQFMRSTGRLFGMQSDWWYDERRDPVKATEGAIKYLSRLHDEFGDWQLACAAYNSGELKIRRAVKRLGTTDFWKLARDRRALRRETKDYVPKMMAAAIIAKNARQFGFDEPKPDPFWVNTEIVKIPTAEKLKTIADVSGVDHDVLQELNPELLRCCTPPKAGPYKLRVPKGDGVPRILAAIDQGEIGRYRDFKRHKITRGDSLYRVAHRYNVPVKAILSMNEVHNLRLLKPGTELIIPGPAIRSTREIASVQKHRTRRAPKGTRPVAYVVRQGDTLYEISRRYAVSIEKIKIWNSIHRAKNLRPGSHLTLYVRNAAENDNDI